MFFQSNTGKCFWNLLALRWSTNQLFGIHLIHAKCFKFFVDYNLLIQKWHILKFGCFILGFSLCFLKEFIYFLTKTGNVRCLKRSLLLLRVRHFGLRNELKNKSLIEHFWFSKKWCNRSIRFPFQALEEGRPDTKDF